MVHYSSLKTISTSYHLYSPHFALVVRFAEGLALVVGVLTLAERDFHLRETTFVDEEAEGYDGLACVLGEFG